MKDLYKWEMKNLKQTEPYKERITDKDWKSKGNDSEVYKRLAELEDLIDANLIFKVPCEDFRLKYFIAEDSNGDLYVACTHHWFWQNVASVLDYSIRSRDNGVIYFYGEDMFDTEEEADQAIEKIIKEKSNE